MAVQNLVYLERTEGGCYVVDSSLLSQAGMLPLSLVRTVLLRIALNPFFPPASLFSKNIFESTWCIPQPQDFIPPLNAFFL